MNKTNIWNEYQQYKNTLVSESMSRGDLLLTLYDELLKRLLKAELSLENQNYELFEASIQKCCDIVYYLERTLNYKYSISRELKMFYDFFIYEFSRLKASRNVQIIHEVRPLIQDLREAFAEADKKEVNNPLLEKPVLSRLKKG